MKTQKISDLVNQLETKNIEATNKELMTGGFELMSGELYELYGAGSGSNNCVCINAYQCG